MLEKYKEYSENSADYNIQVYLITYSSEILFSTEKLVECDEINIESIWQSDVSNDSSCLNHVLSELWRVMSRIEPGILDAEIGYYTPVVFFFCNECDSINDFHMTVKKLKENRWYSCALKCGLYFDYKTLTQMLDYEQAAFKINENFSEGTLVKLSELFAYVGICFLYGRKFTFQTGGLNHIISGSDMYVDEFYNFRLNYGRIIKEDNLIPLSELSKSIPQNTVQVTESEEILNESRNANVAQVSTGVEEIVKVDAVHLDMESIDFGGDIVDDDW